MSKEWDHAFALAFDCKSNDSEGATGAELREALQARLDRLSNEELEVACGAPFDTCRND